MWWFKLLKEHVSNTTSFQNKRNGCLSDLKNSCIPLFTRRFPCFIKKLRQSSNDELKIKKFFESKWIEWVMLILKILLKKFKFFLDFDWSQTKLFKFSFGVDSLCLHFVNTVFGNQIVQELVVVKCKEYSSVAGVRDCYESGSESHLFSPL